MAFAPGDRANGVPKDTVLNLRRNQEFVVNLVDEGLAEAMNQTAATLPHGVSELEHAGLTTAPSCKVQPPRIATAPAAFECREWGTLQIGNNRVVIGTIVWGYVRDELFDAERTRIHTDRLKIIGRMASPHWYCKTTDRFEMVRPA